MPNEIQNQKLPIIMKSGLTHWVGKETHDRVQQALQQQSSHTFMRINELGITVNTAEIEGVYSMEQYHDMSRLKQKQWQCSFKKWHKFKEECQCQQEFIRQEREKKEVYEAVALNKPDSDEERLKKVEALAQMRRDLEASGTLPKKVK